MLDPFKEIMRAKKVSPDRMATMWCELNTYKVPAEFKKELLPFEFGRADRGLIAMEDIVSIIGKKACLRKWREIHCPKRIKVSRKTKKK